MPDIGVMSQRSAGPRITSYNVCYTKLLRYGAAMLVKQTERGDQMFLTMLRRHAAQARDNNALELLP